MLWQLAVTLCPCRKAWVMLSCACSWHQRGLDTAIRAHGRAHAAALQEQAGAGRGDRPGLSRRPVEAEQAAQMLHSSEGMLRAQPTSHAVHCSHAEVCL